MRSGPGVDVAKLAEEEDLLHKVLDGKGGVNEVGKANDLGERVDDRWERSEKSG